MKKITYIVVLLIIILGGAFVYITRPVDSPTLQESIKQAQTDKLNSDESSSVYTVDQSRSTAEFSIYEDLYGKPFTVIGATQSVFGEISLNAEKPESSTVGTIKIDARTLKTDSSKRDGAMARVILNSEKLENNFISFKPVAVSGIPGDAKVGVTYDFKVTGLLMISGVEKSVTFNTSAKMTEKGEIEGVATTEVKRSDFNLKIPDFSFLANVADVVPLKFSFVLIQK